MSHSFYYNLKYFEVKLSTPGQTEDWTPCRVTANLWERSVEICSSRDEKSLSIKIDLLLRVQVEEDSPVLRLEADSDGDRQTLMFPCQEEQERFCLLLDYCRKTVVTTSANLFLLRSTDCLLTSSLQWRPASGRRLQFLGRHFYLLQTETRLVRSLLAAELFIK